MRVLANAMRPDSWSRSPCRPVHIIYTATFTYNADGTLAEKIDAVNDALHSRRTYLYDDAGFLREVIHSSYSTRLSSFVEDSYSLFDYGENNENLGTFTQQ